MSEPLSLTPAELDAELGEQLPGRDVLALVNINAILAAANVGLAANALAVDSTAAAYAGQTIAVFQS
jgi:hypothetical protein